MSRISKAFKSFDQSLEKEKLKIPGNLGMSGGIVEVPTRPSFVYVRLRNNRSELIQAFNDQVSPTYDLPVLVVREGNRYIISGRDTERYQNWENNSPYLPRHSDSHRFSYDTGGGGDIVWVEGRQFLPAMVFPSGSVGSMNVLQSPYTLKDLDGNWKVIGNTGTVSLDPYRPKSGSSLVLVSFDTVSGNPYLLATTGTFIQESFTGTASLVPYLPFTNDPRYRPEAFVRLVSGTQVIDWDNIYDVRQFITAVPTGTSGGGTIYAQNEGGASSAVNTFNFVGDNVDVSVSGTVARVYVTGSSAGTSPIYQRNITSNLTLQDGEALVTAKYINAGAYNVTLLGDSDIMVL